MERENESESGITLNVTLVVFAQMLELEGAILNCGKGFTVSEAEAVAVQELSAVIVTSYTPPWFS